MRPLRSSFVCALLAVASIAAPSAAWASKPSHTSGSTATPLALTSESIGNNPNSPSWCLNEDDYHQSVYSGSLSGSYVASEHLCGLSTDFFNGVFWDAGGIGLESDVYVVGQLVDLSITSPTGAVHHAVLMGQSTSRGATTYHYAVCYVPTYSILTDTGGAPLFGGAWQITLSGQISSARWAVNSQMTDVVFQRQYCPASEQSLVP